MSPSDLPLPEKSKEMTSYPCFKKYLAIGSASNLLEPSPCAYRIQLSDRFCLRCKTSIL